MKILITGGSGLLGQYLNIALSKENDILTLYKESVGNCKSYNNARADITDHLLIKNIFEQFRPGIVIHTAAVSTPQAADNIPSKAVYALNVNAVKNIAELSAQYKARLIYTSTDLVYAGYRGSMLNEDAKLIPVSLYAETKLMGEEKIKSVFDNYIILRTALMFGFGLNGRKNHFHQVYDNLKAGKQVRLFNDQYRTPLSLINAAEIISELCKKDIKSETINFGGAKRLSRFQLGEILCSKAGLDNNLLQPISMNDIPDYPHVADVSMNTDKLNAFGIHQESAEAAVERILRNTLGD